MVVALNAACCVAYMRLYHDCLPHVAGSWRSPLAGMPWEGSSVAIPPSIWVPPPNFRSIAAQILDTSLNIMCGIWLLVLGVRYRINIANGVRGHIVWSWAMLGVAAGGLVSCAWFYTYLPYELSESLYRTLGFAPWGDVASLTVVLHPICLIPYPFVLLLYFYRDPEPVEPVCPSP